MNNVIRSVTQRKTLLTFVSMSMLPDLNNECLSSAFPEITEFSVFHEEK